MALASLHNFRRTPKLGAVEVSVSISEQHSLSATMPDVPVERGSDLQDHRSIGPAALTMEGAISAVAMRSTAEINEDGQVVREPSNDQPFTVEEAYARLLETFHDSEPFDVLTGLRSYTSMHFESLVIIRDKSTGGILRFTAALKQIEFAETSTVRVRSKKADTPKTQPKQKPGAKGAKPSANKSTALKAAQLFAKDPGQGLLNLLGASP